MDLTTHMGVIVHIPWSCLATWHCNAYTRIGEIKDGISLIQFNTKINGTFSVGRIWRNEKLDHSFTFKIMANQFLIMAWGGHIPKDLFPFVEYLGENGHHIWFNWKNGVLIWPYMQQSKCGHIHKMLWYK